MEWLQAIYKESKSFQDFTKNTGLSVKDMRKLNEDLQREGGLSDITLKFLEVLCENKRLGMINHIAAKFGKLYSIMNKEEKIRIISAAELSQSEQAEVMDALRQG